MIGQIIAAFFGMVVLDFVWAHYTRAVANKHPIKAAFNAGAITLLNGTVVLSFVHNPWMLVPAVAGAVVGTYAALWT